MTSYVLCHGAWGGSYGFKFVRPYLIESGHDVYTPSLTGIGERAHLTGPMVNLSLHIKDLVNAIRYEDLDEIVLLGFSYGGMVVTGALDHIGDRVRHLVYLDAWVPTDGQSAIDLFGASRATLVAGASFGDEPSNDWMVPPLPRGLEPAELAAWSDARRVAQPILTLTEPVRLSQPLESRPHPLTYIKAGADPGEDPNSAFWRAGRHAQQSDRWHYHEIAATHMIPLTHPEALANILLGLD
jgi:pimeloyl-ACP methyl ester carboxylesterase